MVRKSVKNHMSYEIRQGYCLSTTVIRAESFLISSGKLSKNIVFFYNPPASVKGGIQNFACLRRHSSHLVMKRDRAALVGFDLRQVEGDVSVELLEEWDPITNQDRQDRITNFVG